MAATWRIIQTERTLKGANQILAMKEVFTSKLEKEMEGVQGQEDKPFDNNYFHLCLARVNQT